MSELPYFQSDVPALSLLQTRWRSILNPLLGLPILDGNLLTDIALTTAANPNLVYTKLGRLQRGWIITDINKAATIYRSASFNTSTLSLTTSADCTVSLWVF